MIIRSAHNVGIKEAPRIWNIPGPETAPTYTNGALELYLDCRIELLESFAKK